MPLYQFELVGADTTTSLDGALLEDAVQAKEIALSLAEDVRTARPELIAYLAGAFGEFRWLVS